MTPQATAALRAVSTALASCKICGGPAPLFDVVDFHKSCRENQGFHFELAGVPIYYRRCTTCGFLFTDAFDDWEPSTFATFIYNADYAQVDPDYAGGRAANNATFLNLLFEAVRTSLSVLDWGGGEGVLAGLLRESGFGHVETYDPFVPAHPQPPTGVFDLVTCFETLEHLPDPRQSVGELAARVTPPGVIVFSTLLQPDDIAAQRTGWWYVAPRNGHISLFSRDSLVRAWALEGFEVASFTEAVHVAYRVRPPFVRS